MTRMKKSIEIEGSTVEDAINKAVKQLGVPRESLLIKVVCEEQKGLFGMEGAKSAKIKVSINDKKSGLSNQKGESRKN